MSDGGLPLGVEHLITVLGANAVSGQTPQGGPVHRSLIGVLGSLSLALTFLFVPAPCDAVLPAPMYIAPSAQARSP